MTFPPRAFCFSPRRRKISGSRSARHFRKALSVAAELYPWLGAIAEDLHSRLPPARVVERAGHDHRDVRHHLGLVEERRSAFRAKASVGCFAAVTPTSERLQRALHIQCRRWQRHDNGKGRPGTFLAVLAVAHADKSRL